MFIPGTTGTSVPVPVRNEAEARAALPLTMTYNSPAYATSFNDFDVATSVVFSLLSSSQNPDISTLSYVLKPLTDADNLTIVTALSDSI